MAVPTPESFASLLRRCRRRAGLSQNRLARASGIDAAYVNRMEAASEARPIVPSLAVLERLGRALELSVRDRDRFYFAAGRCPPTLAAVGSWDPAVAALAELLADESLEEDDRAELRQVVAILVDRWRRSVDSRSTPAGC